METSDSEDSFHTASTSYSESEYGSDSTNSTSNDGNGPHIQPYIFEPRRAVVEREMVDADGEADDDRLGNLDWYV